MASAIRSSSSTTASNSSPIADDPREALYNEFADVDESRRGTPPGRTQRRTRRGGPSRGHHRHHDLSIRLVTQTVDEFFEHPESEAILDQCAVKQFHRLDSMDEHWVQEFGLNYAQMRYVQEAVPGNEDAGYAEALVGVDGEWRGITVEAMPTEKAVIDYDPTDSALGDLDRPVSEDG